MKIIVGLGNIDKEYENTNHNVGFMVVDEVAKKFDVKFSKKQCDCVITEIFVDGEKYILAKPLTYMNNSGIAVRKLVNKYKIDCKSDLVIISDDFDCKSGTIRIRRQSGNTTHNGIKSIKFELKTNEFLRIKVSIGAKPEYMDTANFVLSKIKSDETYVAINKAKDAVTDFINGASVDDLMQKYSS